MTSELKLTAKEIEEVKGGKHTAALVWHQSSDFVKAVSRGVKDQFAELGIDVVAETQANFVGLGGWEVADEITVEVRKDPLLTKGFYRVAVD